MNDYIKTFYVGNVEIEVYENDIEIATGESSQALDKEQILELLTILQNIVKGEL